MMLYNRDTHPGPAGRASLPVSRVPAREQAGEHGPRPPATGGAPVHRHRPSGPPAPQELRALPRPPLHACLRRLLALTALLALLWAWGRPAYAGPSSQLGSQFPLYVANADNTIVKVDSSGTQSVFTTGGLLDYPFGLAFAPSSAFRGFFPPVDNPPTVNVTKAGSAIPVRFSLGGDQGLGIFAPGSPTSQQVTCTTAPLSGIEETVTAGGSSLAYDPTTQEYTYVWKTSTAWKGTCRQLVVQLHDGSTHVALVQFK